MTMLSKELSAAAPLDPIRNPEWEGAYRRSRIIVLAMIVSVLTYGIIGVALTRSGALIPNPDNEFPLNALVRWGYGAAFALSLAVVFLRRFWFGSNRLYSVTRRGGGTALTAHLTSRTIILCVVSEMVALGGLLLTIVLGTTEPILRLGAVSLALLALLFPRRTAWENTLETFSQALKEDS